MAYDSSIASVIYIPSYKQSVSVERILNQALYLIDQLETEPDSQLEQEAIICREDLIALKSVLR